MKHKGPFILGVFFGLFASVFTLYLTRDWVSKNLYDVLGQFTLNRQTVTLERSLTLHHDGSVVGTLAPGTPLLRLGSRQDVAIEEFAVLVYAEERNAFWRPVEGSETPQLGGTWGALNR